MNGNELNDEIAKELETEKEALLMAEFAPKPIQKGQVKAAKIAWMGTMAGIDFATVYAYIVILSPYWWYGILWLFAGAGGLIFAEWLWERIGNNEEQTRIANNSKVVSAIAVLVMALFSGIVLVMGWQREQWIEITALVSSIGLVCFHAWQAYKYHETDDDYIAVTMDARADAKNQKEIKGIHRAGRRVAAKKAGYGVGAKYQEQHGSAFVAEVGRSYQASAPAPHSSTKPVQTQPAPINYTLNQFVEFQRTSQNDPNYNESDLKEIFARFPNSDEAWRKFRSQGSTPPGMVRRNFADIYNDLMANPS